MLTLRFLPTCVLIVAGSLLLTGCPSSDRGAANNPPPNSGNKETADPGAVSATAKAEDVAAAKKLLDGFKGNAKYTLAGKRLTEVSVKDGSVLKPEDFELFGRLTDLEKLQIFNCRALNDEMAAKLSGLKSLTTLAITNSVINNPTVDMIAASFPNLIDLDLSSNTNLTSGVLKTICGMSKLQRLTLVQNRFDDILTSRLNQLENLKALDLRGNMEAGDSTLEVTAGLPKLTSLKHRSTAVTDLGLEYLANSKSLDSLLMQDFAITGRAGQSIAKLPITQLEIFRCQGFGSDGVLALKGMKLARLTLRDLPAVDDQALEVFQELPELKRLYLHELTSLSDSGLKNLEALKTLETFDIWSVPQLTDATVTDVIAKLPNLKELSLRTTGITDAAIDAILAMPNLQSLTLKDNAGVSEEAIMKLSAKKWTKLDTGAGGSEEPGS